jgi:hypothetical protein
VVADLAVVTLLASIVLTAVVAWRGSRLGAVALALQSIVWLSVNRVAEGPVLLSLGKAHGVVAADLVTVFGLLFAAVAFVRGSMDRSDAPALR